jgi:hypothetical protein
MGTNLALFGWNRSLPGREKTSAAHFGEFVEYLSGLQKSGAIQSFEPVFLDVHGGDMNGFFMIRADSEKLDSLLASDEWDQHVLRAMLHLDGAGVVRGVTGDLLQKRFDAYVKLL